MAPFKVILLVGLSSWTLLASNDAYRLTTIRSSWCTRAQGEINELTSMVDTFRAFAGRYPTEDEGLTVLAQPIGQTPPLIRRVPTDPWGNDYAYIRLGDEHLPPFQIVSYGYDGHPAGGDDVTSEGWTTCRSSAGYGCCVR